MTRKKGERRERFAAGSLNRFDGGEFDPNHVGSLFNTLKQLVADNRFGIPSAGV